jgi:hypothetical protein
VKTLVLMLSLVLAAPALAMTQSPPPPRTRVRRLRAPSDLTAATAGPASAADRATDRAAASQHGPAARSFRYQGRVGLRGGVRLGLDAL